MRVLKTASMIVSDPVVSTGTPIMRRILVTLLFAIGVCLLPVAVFSMGPPEGKGPPDDKGPPPAEAPVDETSMGSPDGQTPAEETVCDGLAGSAFGLCNAYCEATDCGDGVNYANVNACGSLQRNWMRKTGVREFPCDCEDGSVFIPGEGCACAFDLVVEVLDIRVECPGGQGTCEHEVDIEVGNVGTEDIVDPFDVLVELPGVGLGNAESFPAGLGAGVFEQRLGIPIGPGNNCFDPDCEAMATVDVGNVILECVEDNNTGFLVIQG